MILERYMDTNKPSNPPMLVKMIVLQNENFIQNTATGNVSANFQVQQSITVISFTNRNG